jgi:hypothetical protein
MDTAWIRPEEILAAPASNTCTMHLELATATGEAWADSGSVELHFSMRTDHMQAFEALN